MYRSYRLKATSKHYGTDLEFEWDAEAGTFRGRDALKIEGMIADALKEGSVCSHPHPTVYEMTDPARKPAELAVLLGQFWQLPDDLARAYPRRRDRTPPGAVN